MSLRITLALVSSLSLLGACSASGGDVAEGGRGAQAGSHSLGGGGSGGVPSGGASGGTIATGGTGTGATSSGGAATGGASNNCGLKTELDTVNANCSACMNPACCPALQACTNNTECVAIVKCVSGGGTNCAAGHPTGQEHALELAACADDHCRWDCRKCGGLGDLVSFGQTCNTCLQTSCCKEGAACGHDNDCRAALQCFQLCPIGDAACQNDCLGKYNNGGVAGQALLSCSNQKCTTAQCQSCGGLANTLGKSAESQACVEANCCPSAAACANEPDCVAMVACALACPSGDQNCANTCASNHPTGAPLANTFAACFNGVPGGCPC